MIQAKFSLNESHIGFIEQCKQYGFKDKSEMVRAAIDYLSNEVKQRQLRESANLYAEVYENDEETKEWTNSTLSEWPL